MTFFHKISFLLGIGFRNPVEFLDRLQFFISAKLGNIIGKKPNYQFQQGDRAEIRIREIFGQGEADDRVTLDDLERQILERKTQLESDAPFTSNHNADITLARRCYTLCRMIKPEIVIETGVAYGVTTAFILKALSQNNRGILHSIDLPPLGKDADAFVGILVPDDLKSRWNLHRGVSRRILPKLLPQLGKVDLFVHDSLHTYWNIKRELRLVSPYLSRISVVLADDIEDNVAFHEWADASSPEYWAAIREQDKNSAFGIAVFSGK